MASNAMSDRHFQVILRTKDLGQISKSDKITGCDKMDRGFYGHVVFPVSSPIAHSTLILAKPPNSGDILLNGYTLVVLPFDEYVFHAVYV